jgi:hypothetical protein
MEIASPGCSKMDFRIRKHLARLEPGTGARNSRLSEPSETLSLKYPAPQSDCQSTGR